MKRLLLTVMLLANLLLLEAADITAISTAFQKGDAAGLQPVLAKTVDIAISEANRNCDAEEAVSMLAEFFKSNKPESFQLVHHADKGETGFFVAKLKAGKQQYRLNVAYTTVDNKAIVQSIRIE